MVRMFFKKCAISLNAIKNALLIAHEGIPLFNGSARSRKNIWHVLPRPMREADNGRLVIDNYFGRLQG